MASAAQEVGKGAGGVVEPGDVAGHALGHRDPGLPVQGCGHAGRAGRPAERVAFGKGTVLELGVGVVVADELGHFGDGRGLAGADVEGLPVGAGGEHGADGGFGDVFDVDEVADLPAAAV